MDKIHYAGDTVFTGTEIARALLGYARALAQTGKSATVDIPVYREDGSRGTSEFLIGPSSQIVTDAVESDWDEIVDPHLVERLEVASRAVGLRRGVAVEQEAGSSDPDFSDLGDL